MIAPPSQKRHVCVCNSESTRLRICKSRLGARGRRKRYKLLVSSSITYWTCYYLGPRTARWLKHYCSSTIHLVPRILGKIQLWELARSWTSHLIAPFRHRSSSTRTTVRSSSPKPHLKDPKEGRRQKGRCRCVLFGLRIDLGSEFQAMNIASCRWRGQVFDIFCNACSIDLKKTLYYTYIILYIWNVVMHCMY